MQKKIAILMVIVLVFGISLFAVAGTLIPGTLTRKIALKKSGDNPVIPGESPTTGLPLSSASQGYMPILCQIDNNLGAIPQWGVSYADIMYELPIQGQGWTRLTALFSDQYPEEAGPVRSGRVMHADLREEWDSGLIHFGKQEAAGSNMKEILSKYGVTAKGLAIDGIGNKYKDYFSRVRYHAAPHNVSAYVSKIHDMLVPLNYPYPNRPYKFTDDTNYGGTPAQQFSVIHKKNRDTSSTFTYDPSLKGYQRFIRPGAYYDYLNPAELLVYSNVIIQRTKLTFNHHTMNPLLPDVVGGGAADIFVAGQYIAGAWSRDSLTSRTVFYDQNGNELALQRGKSWIIVCDVDTEVVIGDIDASMQNSVFEATTVNEDGERIAAPVDETMNNNSSVSTKDAAKNNNNPQTPTNANMATIKVPNKGPLNMRETASGKSKIITRIPNGTSVEVIEHGEQWTKIKYDQKSGFVMTKYLVFPNK